MHGALGCQVAVACKILECQPISEKLPGKYSTRHGVTTCLELLFCKLAFTVTSLSLSLRRLTESVERARAVLEDSAESSTS